MVAFDKNKHVVVANGEHWIQIDALMDLLTAASAEFISRSKKIGGAEVEAAGQGCAFACNEMRLQLMKLTVSVDTYI